MTERELFKKILGQTSDSPLGLGIVRAEGIYLFDKQGKRYIDLISGISVSNVGHRHPKVITAVKEQLDHYMHLMVYGEYVQSPQVKFAQALCELLPHRLNCVYFVNSGAEAVDGAMKLAKRHTGRTEIISFRNAYHGSSQGALSIMGSEEFKNAYRPLLPCTRLLDYNNEEQLQQVSEATAAVFVEPVQAEAGVILPEKNFLKKLRERCTQTGALLVMDEIQTGMGRTGTYFAFEQHNIVPDILCLAKALGGGLPLGAFICSRELMSDLSHDPPLGHITTFGGNPVCCVAGLAALNVLEEEKLTIAVNEKEKLFHRLLKHPAIRGTRSSGLLIALEFENEALNKKVIAKCVEKGVITDWFLFNSHSMRIAPPLTIGKTAIEETCALLLECIKTCVC